MITKIYSIAAEQILAAICAAENENQWTEAKLLRADLAQLLQQ